MRAVCSQQLFRMRHDVDDLIPITHNAKIEPPISRHPCLPDIVGLVVLLGTQRGVAKIADQECRPAVKGPLNVRRSTLVAATKALRIVEAHYACLENLRFCGAFVPCRDWTIASTESKGPDTRPSCRSRSPSASRASIVAFCSGVSTSSASTIFFGLITTVPLMRCTSTKSPVRRPRASKISLGITTWRRWPILPIGMTPSFRSIIRILFILSDYQREQRCQAAPHRVRSPGNDTTPALPGLIAWTESMQRAAPQLWRKVCPGMTQTSLGA